jgi:agmatine deiminase
MSNRFLQFNYVPYPLWRRQMPGWLRQAARPLLRRWLAVDADSSLVTTPAALARFMARWGLLAGCDEAEAGRLLADAPPVEIAAGHAQPARWTGVPVRLPAQWEPLETVLLTWPSVYPPLWAAHAQMAEGIAPVAPVTILVRSALWAAAARLYLLGRGILTPAEIAARVRFLVLETDDIWVRDYGPLVGLDADGEQVCVKPIFDPLPNYPQARDNAMALRWAAHAEVATQPLDLHIEGGNIWSDGAGTLIVSEQAYFSNPGLTADTLYQRLRGAFAFEKLIVTPRLEREETGHVDLLVKLADARTVLISSPTLALNGGKLRAARALFERERNAAGERYTVHELPAPPLYLNWGMWPVWRSYTNALTVNGRVLVPVFGISTDDAALRIYEAAMPGYSIMPINCAVGANGGGAVHCLTKEIPARG